MKTVTKYCQEIYPEIC